MGYVLKNNGGDATAANQVIQINQLTPDSSGDSVLKDYNNEGVLQEKVTGSNANKSVFKDVNLESVFIDKNTGISIFKKQIQTYATTQVFTATDSSVSDLGTQVQTFLSTNPGIFIMSITYGDSGGVGALAHSCMIVYNI